MGVWLSFFYKFAENREFFQGRFLPYKLGIELETPGIDSSDQFTRAHRCCTDPQQKVLKITKIRVDFFV